VYFKWSRSGFYMAHHYVNIVNRCERASEEEIFDP